MFEDSAAYHLIQVDHAQRGFVARRLAALGLHVGQEQLLMRLWNEDGVTQSDLLVKIGCAAPTLTKAVQRLERVGLIRRERGGRPRVSRVYVTEAGWKLRTAVEEIWADVEKRLVSALPADDYAAFVSMLQRVGAAFSEADGVGRPGGRAVRGATA